MASSESLLSSRMTSIHFIEDYPAYFVEDFDKIEEFRSSSW